MFIKTAAYGVKMYDPMFSIYARRGRK